PSKSKAAVCISEICTRCRATVKSPVIRPTLQALSISVSECLKTLKSTVQFYCLSKKTCLSLQSPTPKKRGRKPRSLQNTGVLKSLRNLSRYHLSAQVRH